MDRSTARATGISIALHAVALGGALLIRSHVPDGPTNGTVINAEIVIDAGFVSSAPSVPAATDATGAPPDTPPLPRDDTPPSSREPAANAALAEIASAPASEQHADDASTPDASAAAASTTESAEPLDDASDSVSESAVAAAAASDAATIDERIAPEPEPEPSSFAAAATASTGELGGASPKDAERADTRPAEPLTTREHDMLDRRFASWTGRLAPPGAAESRVAWKQNGRAYTAVFHQQPSGDPMGVEHVVVDVTTTQGGKKFSTQMTMTRLSFSNFAQFVDRWDPEVQIHDDEIDGRFHSNSEIRLLSTGSASPVFHGKVTLAAHDIDTGDSMAFLNRRRVFPEGVEMGVHKIALPSRFLGFLNDAANGDANVQRFEREARITFYEDGSYGWSYVRDGASEERRMLTAPAHYLLGLEGATLRIKGRVRGKVLVYTPERIVIENDLRYARARDAADADDYVGLVAEKSVEIAPPEVTGLGDLHVDASIYALRQFAVREFRSRPSGTLTIFGSLTAGSLTATEPRYATKIEFDPRLKDARPPSFPLTDRYELESWDGQWRVDEERAPAHTDTQDAASEIDPGADDNAGIEAAAELSASSSR